MLGSRNICSMRRGSDRSEKRRGSGSGRMDIAKDSAGGIGMIGMKVATVAMAGTMTGVATTTEIAMGAGK